jgi:CDP-alcohol phosphatidyltransferase
MPSNRARAAVAPLATPARASYRTTAGTTGDRREARLVEAGPAVAMIVPVLLVTAVSAIVSLSGTGLTASGWVVGITCGGVTGLGLARARSHFGADRLTPADWVTLARATLATAVAALVADSFVHPRRVGLLVSLASGALVLDAIDGWVARRTATGSLGARFDAEVDAFLILVLSVYVARSVGAWVLLIGAARYVFLAAGWLLPWLREPLPPRYWRKFVAATQGIVLTVAAANVLPSAVNRAGLVCALILLAESFGRDVWWLRLRRRTMSAAAAVDSGPPPAGTEPRAGRRRARTVLATVLTVLAALLVWVALVGPDQPIALKLDAFLRLPLEGFVLIALGAVFARRARSVLIWVVGPLLGLVLILKLLNIGFYTGFDRPFDAYQDLRYVGFAKQTLRESAGQATAILVLVALGALVIGVPVLMSLAVRRLTRIAAEHRVWTLRAVAGLGAGWILCWALGAELVSRTPVASVSAASLLVSQVNAVQADIRDRSVFARQISHDRFAATPANQLLTGLRGKDVLLLFVESYGEVAVRDSSIAAADDAVLAREDKRLHAAGFSARSAFMTSPTFGGISWLAHSTFQSGLWVNTPQRYSQLLASHRFTLTEAFDRAGWRTVDDVPSDDKFWPPGKTFYHFDKLYDRYDVGYHGPSFAFASMPDQYVMGALQRRELAKRKRRPVFAEVDLVSSHEPWTKIPRMIPWNQLGNGSIFSRRTVDTGTGGFHVGDFGGGLSSYLHLDGSPAIRAAYGQSIRYTMNAVTSFVQHYGTRNTVLVVLGDHQPWSVVSGAEPSRKVPISIIAHDPSVLKRISGWGWNNGLLPSANAPVWPMSAFRDRFLTAFGPRPGVGASR